MSETTGIYYAPSNKCTRSIETLFYLVWKFNNKHKGQWLIKYSDLLILTYLPTVCIFYYILNFNENSNTHINYSSKIASTVFLEYRIS